MNRFFLCTFPNLTSFNTHFYNSFSCSTLFRLFWCTDSDSPLYFYKKLSRHPEVIEHSDVFFPQGSQKTKVLDYGLRYYHTHYISGNRKNKSTQNICCAFENFKLQLRANCTDSVGTSPVILQTLACFPLLSHTLHI